jgi:uncharacterized protein YjiS (DUF1127 family)
MTSITMTAEKIGLTGVANWFKKLAAKYKHHRQAQITIKELSRLSDRELNDMGLARGDIYTVAHGTSDHVRAVVNKNLEGWV